jgi:hypothetical protein
MATVLAIIGFCLVEAINKPLFSSYHKIIGIAFTIAIVYDIITIGARLFGKAK